jgi:integrase
MVAIAVGTCMRLDEMLHLAWDDVDLESRLITIQRGRQGAVKGGRIRHVPILDSLLPVLRQRALRRAGAFLVFPGVGGRARAKTPVQCGSEACGPRQQAAVARPPAHRGELVGAQRRRHLPAVAAPRPRQHTITQKVYAHLAPEAWQQDYHRLAFRVPSEPAKVYEVRRDEHGKLAGRRVRLVLEPGYEIGSTFG